MRKYFKIKNHLILKKKKGCDRENLNDVKTF